MPPLNRHAIRALALLSVLAVACRATPITRDGPPQARLVSRVYPIAMEELRAKILDRYSATREQLSDAFRALDITGQPPPGFSPDWLAGYVDPGGFLKPYVDLPDSLRARDLILREATGDKYWTSEYRTGDGPIRFRCALIVHFVPHASNQTELQVFEVVPTVWVGEHWTLAKEGIGPAKVHDIRFVEPTVRDRLALLEFVDAVVR